MITLISDDFPAPLSPMTPSTSPGRRSKSVPASAVTRPKRLIRPRAASTVSGAGGGAASVSSSTTHAADPPDPLVHRDGDDDEDADGERAPQRLDARLGQAAVEHADDQGPEQRTEHVAPPAEQARAADHHGGDRVEVGVLQRLRRHRADAADPQPPGDARRSSPLPMYTDISTRLVRIPTRRAASRSSPVAYT